MNTAIRHLLPPELDRIRYGSELCDAGRRASAGLRYALILPLTRVDGTNDRYLLADEEAHAARERYRRRAGERERERLSAAETRRYDEAFAVLDACWAEDGGGAA